jgi:hypothetical protein
MYVFVLVHDHHFENLSVIAKNNYNIPVILLLLDDFLTIQTADTSGDRTMAILIMIFKKPNIPLSTKKTMGPDTTYLGVILDTANMEARLPQSNVDQINSFIGTFTIQLTFLPYFPYLFTIFFYIFHWKCPRSCKSSRFLIERLLKNVLMNEIIWSTLL